MDKVLDFIKDHTRDDARCLKCLNVTDFHDYETINDIEYILWKCPKCGRITKTPIEEFLD